MYRSYDRFRCHYATEFRVDAIPRGGTILDASRNGMLVFVGRGLRRGQRLTFGLDGVKRRATVVRFDRHGNVGLKLERPLSHTDMRAVFARRVRPRR